jgi:hypothetical protein
VCKMADEYDSQLINKILTLCWEQPKYIPILRNIADADKTYEADPYGWQFSEVSGLSEEDVNILIQEGTIRYGDKSNRATHFKSNIDVVLLKIALDVFEENIQKEKSEAKQQHEHNILVEKVKALCAKNPDYESLLRKLIEVDKMYENDRFGFQFVDVQWSGGQVNTLMQNGIIKYGYKSNSATHFRLNVPCEELESILDDIELARLEAEKRRLEAEKEHDEPVEEQTPKSGREPIPERVKMYVWKRDGGKCVKCGSNQKLEYDHIIPLSKRGEQHRPESSTSMRKL